MGKRTSKRGAQSRRARTLAAMDAARRADLEARARGGQLELQPVLQWDPAQLQLDAVPVTAWLPGEVFDA